RGRAAGRGTSAGGGDRGAAAGRRRTRAPRGLGQHLPGGDRLPARLRNQGRHLHDQYPPQRQVPGQAVHPRHRREPVPLPVVRVGAPEIRRGLQGESVLAAEPEQEVQAEHLVQIPRLRPLLRQDRQDHLVAVVLQPEPERDQVQEEREGLTPLRPGRTVRAGRAARLAVPLLLAAACTPAAPEGRAAPSASPAEEPVVALAEAVGMPEPPSLRAEEDGVTAEAVVASWTADGGDATIPPPAEMEWTRVPS